MNKDKLLAYLENEMILYRELGEDFAERRHELEGLRQKVMNGDFD